MQRRRGKKVGVEGGSPGPLKAGALRLRVGTPRNGKDARAGGIAMCIDRSREEPQAALRLAGVKSV